MNDFASETDSEYTNHWQEWVPIASQTSLGSRQTIIQQSPAQNNVTVMSDWQTLWNYYYGGQSVLHDNNRRMEFIHELRSNQTATTDFNALALAVRALWAEIEGELRDARAAAQERARRNSIPRLSLGDAALNLDLSEQSALQLAEEESIVASRLAGEQSLVVNNPMSTGIGYEIRPRARRETYSSTVRDHIRFDYHPEYLGWAPGHHLPSYDDIVSPQRRPVRFIPPTPENDPVQVCPPLHSSTSDARIQRHGNPRNQEHSLCTKTCGNTDSTESSSVPAVFAEPGTSMLDGVKQISSRFIVDPRSRQSFATALQLGILQQSPVGEVQADGRRQTFVAADRTKGIIPFEVQPGVRRQSLSILFDDEVDKARVSDDADEADFGMRDIFFQTQAWSNEHALLNRDLVDIFKDDYNERDDESDVFSWAKSPSIEFADSVATEFNLERDLFELVTALERDPADMHVPVDESSLRNTVCEGESSQMGKECPKGEINSSPQRNFPRAWLDTKRNSLIHPRKLPLPGNMYTLLDVEGQDYEACPGSPTQHFNTPQQVAPLPLKLRGGGDQSSLPEASTLAAEIRRVYGRVGMRDRGRTMDGALQSTESLLRLLEISRRRLTDDTPESCERRLLDTIPDIPLADPINRLLEKSPNEPLPKSAGPVGHSLTTWNEQFMNSRGNEYFCDVDEEYLTDRFNLTGLNTEVQHYQYALDLVTDVFDLDCDDEVREQIEKSARHLYGLVHARYIVTTRGLQKMMEKYKNGDFGKCPRVACDGQPLLPMGQHDNPNLSAVKLYCARCEDLYNPKSSRHSAIDGAYFGTSFHNILFQVYPHLLPPKTQRRYEPRIYGFRVHAAAALARWQAEQRDAMKDRLIKEGIETGFEDEEREDEMLESEEDEADGIDDMFEARIVNG